eukprot:TRINITY_DN2740_c0_g1_i1.p1 TRINITY_DN2740_c0_g1~~TRINITY_DN2740_c0_g1_i1.p1  ORF type:complete len:282 (-),score=24.07 TRINITY_DN2740_c0_g1_i1:1175-1936(-)
MAESGKIPPELFMAPKLAEVFQCLICQFVPAPDMACGHPRCGAIFCTSCLCTWVKKSPTCPKCREKLSVQLNKDTNLSMYFLQQKLELKCPYRKDCAWVGELSGLEAHRKECGNTIIQCHLYILGCKFEGTLKEVLKHMEDFKEYHLMLTSDLEENLISPAEANSEDKPNEESKEEVKIVYPDNPKPYPPTADKEHSEVCVIKQAAEKELEVQKESKYKNAYKKKKYMTEAEKKRNRREKSKMGTQRRHQMGT